jgi:hypothetical protein
VSDESQGESLSDVVASGDTRRSLEAIRERLAGALESAKYTKDLPPLAKQLVDVMAAIDALPAPGEVSVLDEIAAKRVERRAEAAGS